MEKNFVKYFNIHEKNSDIYYNKISSTEISNILFTKL